MGGGEDTEGSDNDRLAHIVGGAGSWEELHTWVIAVFSFRIRGGNVSEGWHMTHGRKREAADT